MTPAARRYNGRFLLSMGGYAVVLTGATWIMRQGTPTAPLIALLTVASTLPIAGALIATGAYLLHETDEYLRRRIVAAMLMSFGVILCLASALGFLQQRGVIGGVELLWAFPLWCLLWAVAQCVLMLRDSRTSRGAA